jgi:dipeptidyl aminopeptidase/acylaminoacyl peptidase
MVYKTSRHESNPLKVTSTELTTKSLRTFVMWGLAWIGVSALVLLVAFSLMTPAKAQPVDDFFRLPDTFRPSLSPDGSHLAVLSRSGNGRLNVGIVDLEARKVQIITNMETVDVVNVRWVNNKRLVFVTGNLQDPSGNQAYWRTGGLFAIERDGTEAKRLAAPLDRGLVLRPRFMQYVMSVGGASDDIIALANDRSFDSLDVYRVNTRTGRKEIQSFDVPGDVSGWALDSNGKPRAAAVVQGLRTTTYFKTDEKAPWTRWSDFDFREPHVLPLTVWGDGTVVGLGYKNANGTARDTIALVQMNPANGAVTRVLAGHPEFDVIDTIYDPLDKRTVGAVLAGPGSQVIWIDDYWSKLQKQIDTALPNARNVLVPSSQEKRAIIVSYSDKNPGDLYFLDLKTNKLEFGYSFRRSIKPEQMSPSRMIRVVARDGLPIHAQLTIPKNSNGKNLPLVVLVHGGPWVPGFDGSWEPEAQFLASRGFAVLQPNFRGTVGYGAKHFKASFKQWGGTMADDLIDTADWVVKQGIADPKRLCIYGASYGGYAALQAAVKTPDYFRCAVSYVGVTDLTLLHSVTWSDLADSDFSKHYLPVMMGDRSKDAVMLRETSPLQNVERIKIPVFLAYGGSDVRVPLVHGERMRDALQKAGKPVEWMVKPDEGHGFVDPVARTEFYTKLEQFLRANTR